MCLLKQLKLLKQFLCYEGRRSIVLRHCAGQWRRRKSLVTGTKQRLIPQSNTCLIKSKTLGKTSHLDWKNSSDEELTSAISTVCLEQLPLLFKKNHNTQNRTKYPLAHTCLTLVYQVLALGLLWAGWKGPLLPRAGTHTLIKHQKFFVRQQVFSLINDCFGDSSLLT